MGAEEFDIATERVHDLPEQPSAQDLLHLYKLYKQAKFGDCNSKRPGGMDLKGQYKWDAWNSVRGMSVDEAMEQYVAFTKELFSMQGQSFY